MDRGNDTPTSSSTGRDHDGREETHVSQLDGGRRAAVCGRVYGRRGGCTCALCKADVVAHALNHLPPRYVRTEAGRMMVEISSYDVQFRADVLAALGEAVKLVQGNPRH